MIKTDYDLIRRIMENLTSMEMNEIMSEKMLDNIEFYEDVEQCMEGLSTLEIMQAVQYGEWDKFADWYNLDNEGRLVSSYEEDKIEMQYEEFEAWLEGLTQEDLEEVAQCL